MIQTIRKAWGVPELRKKIVFTLLILLIFRIGNAIPVPYINTTLLGNYLDSMSGTVLGLYNVMSGGAFAEATVFALGVQPYINSSIIIQLLTIAIPALERLARDGGEAGKKKIASITRYATVAIALLQGFGYYMICKNYNILEQQGIWPALVIIVSFVAGSSFVMWLGEQVNEFGVGNGISIILFAGILSRVPNMVTMCASYIASKGSIGYLWIALLIVGILAMIVLIVHVNEAERRIPVQYAKRQVGRKMYGGQASTLPMKVNMSGVLPIIFAQSIASLPATIWAFAGTPEEGTVGRSIYNAIDTKSVLYLIVYFVMIIGFSYFYATIQFNPIEISNNLKRNGGFIPGFRPGKPTSDFIAKVLNKVTLFGAIYLGIVAICPLIVGMLAMVVLIVHVNEAERRIPVQYAKRQVGRKMYGGQASTLPMKVNMSGVLPIIFAQTIASLPATIWAFIGIPEEGTVGRSIYNAIDTKSVLYLIVYFLMIIGFSYFYATIQFNPVEISNNLKRNGGFIPGFRPGKPTSDFIAKVLNKVTLFGAIYLGIVAICPLIAGKLLGNSSLAIGGTSVIIVVGVALETVRALESQMMMRQYKGFLG